MCIYSLLSYLTKVTVHHIRSWLKRSSAFGLKCLWERSGHVVTQNLKGCATTVVIEGNVCWSFFIWLYNLWLDHLIVVPSVLLMRKFLGLFFSFICVRFGYLGHERTLNWFILTPWEKSESHYVVTNCCLQDHCRRHAIMGHRNVPRSYQKILFSAAFYNMFG